LDWLHFARGRVTPKTVQTEELRTSLVYEVRAFVKDPDDVLRLGMPATVYFANMQHPDQRLPAAASPAATTPRE